MSWRLHFDELQFREHQSVVVCYLIKKFYYNKAMLSSQKFYENVMTFNKNNR